MSKRLLNIAGNNFHFPPNIHVHIKHLQHALSRAQETHDILAMFSCNNPTHERIKISNENIERVKQVSTELVQVVRANVPFSFYVGTTGHPSHNLVVEKRTSRLLKSFSAGDWWES